MYRKCRGTGLEDRYDLEEAERPTPELDVHRRFAYHDHPGKEGLPNTYAEALKGRPEVELVAGADPSARRLDVYRRRYGVEALYTDAAEMLRKERLDIVAIATNVRGRADLTVLAVESGVKGIVTEKPMLSTLEEADRMVQACAEGGVPISCGAISTTHPSFAAAKDLIAGGAIGDVVSIEARGPGAQHPAWSYFVDSPPAWVAGTGDRTRCASGSDEFEGQGIMVPADGLVVHYRLGAPMLRVTSTAGEISREREVSPWRLWQDIETPAGVRRVELPWPDPQFVPPYGGVYSLADVIDCLEGRLDEPKNSARRVAVALKVEIALKQSSAQGGARVDLPLADRSLGLSYDWFR